MSNKTIIITGSSRNDGDTSRLVQQMVDLSGYESVSLNDYSFGYYDYDHKNRDDDFLPLMKFLIEGFDTFIFATPVYWYSMSGIMKVFFDRITDLLDDEKDLGRKLRKKKMAVITTSTGSNLGEYFWLPFIETANYLGMKYTGNLHTINDNTDIAALKELVLKINEN